MPYEVGPDWYHSVAESYYHHTMYDGALSFLFRGWMIAGKKMPDVYKDDAYTYINYFLQTVCRGESQKKEITEKLLGPYGYAIFRSLNVWEVPYSRKSFLGVPT